MAANTISGRGILFYLAQHVGELKSAWVTARTSDTVFVCGGLETDANDDDFYNYGLLRTADASTIVLITDYNGATRQFTVGAGLTIAVGTRVEFCWANAKKRAAALAAVNEAIREAYPYWYREVVVEGASSGITLSAGDDDYALPAACDALIAVGVGANPIQWIPAVEASGRVNYHVEGQPGALILRAQANYTREGTLADAHTGKELALHYATREPEIAETAATCQLPADYFMVAALAYQRQALNDASRLDLATASVNIPQLAQVAQVALSKLGIGKTPPGPGIPTGAPAARGGKDAPPEEH